ncbi:MAG TPA: UdgX family uracil-DNA binding protein [Solirubrobacteraceae bacterium]|nr:UdgX family uracil-DNA binding protein [Solirubrobacteraceae bacterium]
MSAREFIPERPTLSRMRAAAVGCRGCELWRDATQTVFGEGPAGARIVLVGEMAGDREDRAGRPFVGPAGRELDRALEAAEIERRDVYVTNVVKHFKFEERRKRRIHQTPRKGEIDACTPWLETEIKLIRPTGVVALGATAAKALLGSAFRVTQHRGELIESDLAPIVAATIHPSAIVRDREDESRRRERQAFADDLRGVARAVAALT